MIKTAITPTRAEDFPQWYQNVIRAADMAENSPVRGCMVIKPYGFALWENIQRALDDMIREAGVQNAYFPLLIPLSFISREAEHVDGFAKECAVVTHYRLEQGPDGGLIPSPEAQLEEPLIIRPTSETIIGDSMAKWVQSYRDLPLKLNQWCNVMRWERRTRLFLRTSEFLWQEGHNAFATADEAEADARKMLDIYRQLYEDWLAMPGLCGEKTADEQFPGAEHSYTMEGMMQDGKALQMCTSHNLGQNFARSFDIKYQGEDGQKHLAHTTSWGFSTRSVGGLVMTHSDDDGLIAPPKIAPFQVALIPVVKDDTAAAVMAYCETLAARLKDKGIRVHMDRTDRRTPDKMWDAIKKGIPLRVEAGGREAEAEQVTHVRRDLGRDSKTTCSMEEFVAQVSGLLDDIQTSLYTKAQSFLTGNITDVSSLDAMKGFFAAEQPGFVKIKAEEIEKDAFQPIQNDFAVTPRCLPFEDEGRTVVVGRAY
jgi:prolyl-tRNA synthetase